MKKLTKQAIAITLAILMLAGLATPAMAARHPFSDVRDGRWYSEAVQFVYEHNIMGGVGNNQFDPQGNLTRAQVTALLFRVHNERTANAQDSRNNNFNDVNNEWFAPYVTWAFNNNIVTGTSSTTFNPHGNISRQEFATMVYRYAMNMTVLYDWSFVSGQWTPFADRGRIATWAYSALRWMNFHGIVTGPSATTINPTGTATRAEAAVMMMRFAEILPLPFEPPLSLELVVRIRGDWAAHGTMLAPENVRISHYFGTYNGNIALLISDRNELDGEAVMWRQNVAGVEFRYGSTLQILVWDSENFFSLPEAFEQGLITTENVRNINYRHRQAFPRIYEWDWSS